jgi:signal recognition particle receptor subunit alpha
MFVASTTQYHKVLNHVSTVFLGDCSWYMTSQSQGRMQNNKPLMQALGRLVSDNTPDLCLFVGEALVGNDGVDQLQMFNEALASCAKAAAGSSSSSARQLDGVVLTKFDTVDQKVGAALSLCYRTGQPIVFVGTGQRYTHLRRLNAAFVIKALFS